MKTTNLGFPNTHKLLIKKTVEGFWKGQKTIESILLAEDQVKKFNSAAQSKLDLQPINDIDIYDRMLRTAVMFGIVPKRFGLPEEANKDLAVYLSIPRGTDKVPASPMVKWFNTNYHVVQPEFEKNPRLISNLNLDLKENQKLALIGPWTLLSYGINKTNQTKEELFTKLAEQYVSFINNLSETIVQLEEPCFLTHGMPKEYENFIKQIEQKIHLHVYFGSVNNFAQELFNLPVEGIGLDFIDGTSNLDLLLQFPPDKTLIAGIINGRNVWPVSNKTKKILDIIHENISEDKLYLSPSCSLMHVPITAEGEDKDQIFSFAVEKLAELEAINDGTINYKEIKVDDSSLPTEKYQRSRKTPWVSKIPFPTTTIGSFPQLPKLRKTRNDWRKGKISDKKYEKFIKKYISDCVKKQEKIGLDILVHGEPERADMVQYFAENFEGFTPIKGAVQSYGTRIVRPPVITGPITRPEPFTIDWIVYAQSLTKKPVKGMLTGPVTIVQWSYPREDISKEMQFYDVAQALSQEVDDLVKAGITHIQIDEPALREGPPLDESQRDHYLIHAVNAFRSTYSNIPDQIIIHSHMCFSEFTDIMDAIKELGVDVLSIEDSKAQGKVAASLRKAGIPFSIGLGVYDVHSPRIPDIKEMEVIPLHALLEGMDPYQIWVNPDCGLKTRGEEAYDQLKNMVIAARNLRKQYTKKR